MIVDFDICNENNCILAIVGKTQKLNDQYVPEDEQDIIYLKSYYKNNKYKYSDTLTLNIIEKHTVETPSEIISILYNDHCSYLDEQHYRIEKDGYYTIHHIILPTIEWYKFAVENNLVPDLDIYVTDGIKVYRVSGQEATEVDTNVILEINAEGTTISKLYKDTFIICSLYQCYIDICKQIFNNSNIRCLTNPTDLNDLIFKRDFLWMTINVLEYHTTFNMYYEAQRLLENINYCGQFCQPCSTSKTISSCGCS